MDISHVDTAPDYIKDFLNNNEEQLRNINEAGKHANDGEGCLVMECSQENNKMDVFFLNKEDVVKYIHTDMFKEIPNKNYYLINDTDLKSVFIIYI